MSEKQKDDCKHNYQQIRNSIVCLTCGHVKKPKIRKQQIRKPKDKYL